MTRLPRDIDAKTLIRALERIGYRILRQTGSHIRLAPRDEKACGVTIPNHSPLKAGVLHSILREVASQQGMTIVELVKALQL